jgi:hypothetical protein
MGVLAVCIILNSVWAARRGKADSMEVQTTGNN